MHRIERLWKCGCLSLFLSLLDDDVSVKAFSKGLIGPDSLAYSVATPESYAESMNMTIEEMNGAVASRSRAVDILNTALERETDPQIRRELVTQHRFAHGKHPFVCRRCWSYRPICLCSSIRKKHEKPSVPCRAVVIWTHQDEWGSPSNTGSLIPLLLNDCHILMKGYQHDSLEVLTKGYQPVVLWPEDESRKNNLTFLEPESLSKEELQDIVLVVPEGTWRQARRLASKLPHSWPRLSLSQDKLSRVLPENGSSLLTLLRCRKKAPEVSVCTAEAIVAALLALGLDDDNGQAILRWVRRKVNLTGRHQGKQVELVD